MIRFAATAALLASLCPGIATARSAEVLAADPHRRVGALAATPGGVVWVRYGAPFVSAPLETTQREEIMVTLGGRTRSLGVVASSRGDEFTSYGSGVDGLAAANGRATVVVNRRFFDRSVDDGTRGGQVLQLDLADGSRTIRARCGGTTITGRMAMAAGARGLATVCTPDGLTAAGPLVLRDPVRTGRSRPIAASATAVRIGGRMLAWLERGQIVVLDMSSGAEVRRLELSALVPALQGPPAFAVGDDGTLAIADPRAPEVVVAAAGRPPRRVSTAPGISALWPAGAAVAIARSEGTVSVLPAQGSERLVAGFAPAGGIDFDGRAFLVARGRCDGTEIVRIPVGPRPDLQRVDRCPPLLLDARLGTDGRLVLRFGCTRLVPSRSSDRCRLRVAVPGFGSARRAVGPGAVAILRLPRPGRRSTRHLRVTAASTTRGGTLRRTFRIRPSLNP